MPKLRVDGLVNSPVEFTADGLAAIDGQWQIPDMSRLDSKRKGKAVRLAGILSAVQPQPLATHLTLHASTDDFHASVPLEDVRERGVVIYAGEDGPLPSSAGGPFRFYVQDFAACHSAEVDECANVKFVDRIELTHGKGLDTRPADERGHAELHRKQA